MKFQVILVQTKTLSVEIEAGTADRAVYLAKEEVEMTRAFDKRIARVSIADVKEIERDTS